MFIKNSAQNIVFVACVITAPVFVAMDPPETKNGDSLDWVALLILKSQHQREEQELRAKKFLEATERGDLETVSALVWEGVDIDAKGLGGETALHIAARLGFSKLVEFLIVSKVCLNIRNDRRRTALHLASEQGYGNVVMLLVNSGAALNIPDITQKTPLALCKNHVVIEFLKSKGAC